MRSREEVALVMRLAAQGHNISQIARQVGVCRTTVRSWLAGGTPNFDKPGATCPACSGRPWELPQPAYAYLLGLYLGDGCLSARPRGVWHLRIACANRYPQLMRQCEAAMAQVMPLSKVGRVGEEGCTTVQSTSKHWICLFPQHGPGRKHERRIELVPWQQEIVDQDPRPLVKGLLHSDGCRVLNWVNGTPYPRYHFTNVSPDIRAIFGRACDQLGVEWRQNNRVSLSVARRASVALLDEFVGPKS
jgi:Winged helix-turn helix